MNATRTNDDTILCPDCKGRGMIRPPGEWANETCPTCDGRGEVAADALRPPSAVEDHAGR
jgi:DnaJ-class molecular chaperone